MKETTITVILTIIGFFFGMVVAMEVSGGVHNLNWLLVVAVGFILPVAYKTIQLWLRDR